MIVLLFVHGRPWLDPGITVVVVSLDVAISRRWMLFDKTVFSIYRGYVPVFNCKSS